MEIGSEPPTTKTHTEKYSNLFSIKKKWERNEKAELTRARRPSCTRDSRGHQIKVEGGQGGGSVWVEHLFLYCLSFPLRNMAERSRPIYTQRWVPLQLWRGARLWQIEAGRKEQHALPCAVRWSANRRGPNQIALVTLARLLPFYLPALAKSREGKKESADRGRQRSEVLCDGESPFSKPAATA